jgi:tetratricopeptide (TPR) repeat protein
LENDPENKRILYNFGNFYEEKNDYPNMFRYYNAAADLNDSDALFKMAKHHINVEKNRQAMLECYLKGIEYYSEDDETEEDIKYTKKYYGFNHFELQEILDSVENPSAKLVETLKTLKDLKDISIYNNKVRLFKRLNNFKECNICYEEDKLNIDLHCGHELCTDCYKMIYKKCCPWCRTASYFKK